MAALEAALNELAAQCTGENVPGEVHTLFPNWGTEYPRMSKLPSVSLRKMCSGLQAAEQQAKDEKRSADVAGYAYARGALQAAIDIHDFFGEFSGSQGGVHPPVPLGPGASGNELERLVVRLQAEAPPSVHSIFPNFCVMLFLRSYSLSKSSCFIFLALFLRVVFLSLSLWFLLKDEVSIISRLLLELR